MTDSAAVGTRLRYGLAVLALIIIVLGGVTLVFAYSANDAARAANDAGRAANDALSALKTSSARSECARIEMNKNTDELHQDLANLVDGAVHQNNEQVLSAASTMRNRPDLQKTIDARCPAPLVHTPTTTKKGTP